MAVIGRGRALLYALLVLAVGAVSYAVGVGSWLGQRAEESVLGASAYNTDPPAPLGLVSIPAIAIALLVIAVLAWRFHGLGRAAWILVFSMAAIAASQLLKQELLERPGLLELDAENTFPSGHMTVFTVLVGGLIWALPAGGRGVAAVVGAVVLGTVAWQLLEYGWHRPSDVVGAQALGVLAFALAAAFRLPRSPRSTRGARAGAEAMNRVLGAMLVVVGVALVVGGLALTLAAGWWSSSALMLAASEIAVVGASALTARLLMALAR